MGKAMNKKPVSKSKIKLVENPPVFKDMQEARLDAFTQGFNQGWDACKKELERDEFITRMEERQKFWGMYADKIRKANELEEEAKA